MNAKFAKAHLVYSKVPESLKALRGKRFRLDVGVVRIGSDAKAELTLASSAVAAAHAQLVQPEHEGPYNVIDLGSSAGTYLDGERLPRLGSRTLHDGMCLRFGDVELIFVDASVRAGEGKPRTLAEFWGAAERAPESFDPEMLHTACDLCGTSGLSRGMLQAKLAAHWYSLYRGYQRRPCLPLAPIHLVDLASLIVFRQPPLRPLAAAQVATCANMLRVDYYRYYQQQHLCSLAVHPGTGFIRMRTSREKIDAKSRDEIVIRFIADIANWVTQAWLAHDHGTDGEAKERVLLECGQEFRVITEPVLAQQFLIQLSQITHQVNRFQGLPFEDLRALREIIDPVERFALGARSTIPKAFETMDQILVSECLKSKLLEERDYKIVPVDTSPCVPRVPSRNPGDRTAIKRIRKTSRLEDLPEITPGEYAFLALPDGVRHLTSRLMHEGLQRWERESYDDEIKRERFLVCIVADIGAISQTAGGKPAADHSFDDLSSHARRTNLGNTPNIHARRLTFELLRDIAMFLGNECISLDVVIIMEPIRDPHGRRMACQLTLDELKVLFGKSQYDDMVELEGKVPGFFFRERENQKSELDLSNLVRRAFEPGRYDLTLFAFLGPEMTIRDLLPADLPPPRQELGAKDKILLVQLGAAGNGVELAQGSHFEEVLLYPTLESVSDQYLRYLVIETLLGIDLNPDGDTSQLNLAPKADL